MKTLSILAVLAALLLAAPLSLVADENDEMITMDVKDMDVRAAIQMIASAGHLNVVVSPDVKGSVSLALEDVPARAALHQLAAAVGLRVRAEKDGVLVVEPGKESRLLFEGWGDPVRYRSDILALKAKIAAAKRDPQGDSDPKRALRLALARLTEARDLLAGLKDLPFEEGSPRLELQRGIQDAREVAEVLRQQFARRGEQGPTAEHAKAAAQLDSRSRLLLEKVMTLRAGKSDRPFFLGRGDVRVPTEADWEEASKSRRFHVQGVKPGTYTLGVVEADTDRARALKRYHDLKTAADHLKAAGLHAEATRIYAQAKAAYAEARRAPAQGEGGQDVLQAIHALRQDVGALRGEVKELTALVRQLLKQGRPRSALGIGGGAGGSFRGRAGGAGGAGGGPGGGG